MTTQLSTDDPVAWYRSRLLVPGHPLAITLPYAPAEHADAILALNAMIGEIAAVPGEVSDPEVAQRKLDWWRQALDERLPHPAIQAWLQSGAAEHVKAKDFQPLIGAVATEIAPPRFEQAEELNLHCRALAAPGAMLEARVTNMGTAPGSAEADALSGLAAAGYRIRIVRDLVLDARQERWLVPLELQAEYRLTRQHVAAGEGGRRLAALVRHMAGDALIDMERHWSALAREQAWRHRHFLLRVNLDRRIGRKLVARPERIVRERLAPGRTGDAIATWRRARALRKAARTVRRSD